VEQAPPCMVTIGRASGNRSKDSESTSRFAEIPGSRVGAIGRGNRGDSQTAAVQQEGGCSKGFERNRHTVGNDIGGGDWRYPEVCASPAPDGLHRVGTQPARLWRTRSGRPNHSDWKQAVEADTGRVGMACATPADVGRGGREEIAGGECRRRNQNIFQESADETSQEVLEAVGQVEQACRDGSSPRAGGICLGSIEKSRRTRSVGRITV